MATGAKVLPKMQRNVLPLAIMKRITGWACIFLFIFFSVYTGTNASLLPLSVTSDTPTYQPDFSVSAKSRSPFKYFIRTQTLSNLFNGEHHAVNYLFDRFLWSFHLSNFWTHTPSGTVNTTVAVSISFKILIIYPFHAFW